MKIDNQVEVDQRELYMAPTPALTIEEIPSGWANFLREEQGWEDDEIIDEANTILEGGADVPQKRFWLHETVLINGAPSVTRSLTTFREGEIYIDLDAKNILSFSSYEDDLETANEFGEAINWCHHETNGAWAVTPHKHVEGLFDYYVSFSDPDDARRFDERHRSAKEVAKQKVREAAAEYFGTRDNPNDGDAMALVDVVMGQLAVAEKEVPDGQPEA